MDDIDKLPWKKALEYTARRGEKCCMLNYQPGYVITSDAQLKKAVAGCKVTFVMFFSKTCPYCAAFDPIFRQVGERYRDYANFVKADVEMFYHLAASLGIMGTPATVAFVNGSPVDMAPGFMTALQFRAFVEAVLSGAGCMM